MNATINWLYSWISASQSGEAALAAPSSASAHSTISDTNEKPNKNPYDAILDENQHDPIKIQRFCENQRTSRNAKFRTQILDPRFQGFKRDEVLFNLINVPGFTDPRNNLCVWARPTRKIMDLVLTCQEELRRMSPSIWLMPPDCLHMTVLEIAQSLTPQELQAVENTISPAVTTLASYHMTHRTRLVKPKLSYDDAAIALTFVPAAGEPTNIVSVEDSKSDVCNDEYTYLHLRRDLIRVCHAKGVQIGARYATTSCHLTIARFLGDEDFAAKKASHSQGEGRLDHEKVVNWVEMLDAINVRLEREFWPKVGRVMPFGAGEWLVGSERGLDVRRGRLWYGGGETWEAGDGF
ncbi:hypothetical protein PV10_03014 [Exophiala mesophila]|uniref:DUF1868 domain-containing protein n=1 Tax=Exophiala mesophila TaxID=212818 RepID=A0A0D1ZL26_EXOME|nr:uncharacterized protein PV10_03014 [Exophiala mesophila]KIV95347.1 hypothetical protein PV10_03014 [Exophiala mesophila]